MLVPIRPLALLVLVPLQLEMVLLSLLLGSSMLLLMLLRTSSLSRDSITTHASFPCTYWGRNRQPGAGGATPSPLSMETHGAGHPFLF